MYNGVKGEEIMGPHDDGKLGIDSTAHPPSLSYELVG